MQPVPVTVRGLSLSKEGAKEFKRFVKSLVVVGEWIKLRLERTEEKVLEEQETGDVFRTLKPICALRDSVLELWTCSSTCGWTWMRIRMTCRKYLNNVYDLKFRYFEYI